MRRVLLLVGLLILSVARANAQGGSAQWERLDVTTHLYNDGRVEVVEIHDIAIKGDITVISRGFNYAADQSVVVHGVSRVDPLGVKTAFANAPVINADSYQAYGWGVQFSVRAEKDPPFTEGIRRRYVIEYTLVNAMTPAWDVAAGPRPLEDRTTLENPWMRAKEVVAAWRQATPDIQRKYRLDHDVLYPTVNTAGPLPELNYHFEYDDAWELQDKDRAVGVATPEVDYRVQRTLRYLPAGAPAAVDRQNAALRLASIVAPLILGFGLFGIFLALDRLSGTAVRGDRDLFQKRIGDVPEDLIAGMSGWSTGSPSFERFLLRLAAQKRLSITVESPETDDKPAQVRLRLIGDRGKLHAAERKVVNELFGKSDTVSTEDIKVRNPGKGFDPHSLVAEAFAAERPKRTLKRRPLWATFHLVMMAAGVVWFVKSLLDKGTPDPIPLVMSLIAGNVVVGVWPAGSSIQRVSKTTMALAILALGVLGAVIALSLNTPLSGVASLGLGLLGVGHCAGYLSRAPKSNQDDREFEAARRWALKELTKPRPALLDSWVESIDAMGGRGALAWWKKRYGGQFASAPDLADGDGQAMHSGPPFTGEPLPRPVLPPDWSEGFGSYTDDDEDSDD